MKWLACSTLVLLFGSAVAAQPTSVMIDDLTTTEVQAALDAGKTTAIFYVGGTHQSGDAVALGKHNLLVQHLARRVAETLGDALAYPPSPYAPAGDPIKKTGHMRFAGTVSLNAETFALLSKDVAVSALAVGFKHVMFLGDHGESQATLKRVAAELDAEWKPRGGRVYFIPVYEEGEAAFQAHLGKMGVPSNLHTPIDDASELLALDRSRWVRTERLKPEIGSVASGSLGQTFIDNKVRLAVASIRQQRGK
jgi:creatinine amidohydrolase/Fe(II)-dependent formamide hydrolase-like protein